jgi:hypothetical protein
MLKLCIETATLVPWPSNDPEGEFTSYNKPKFEDNFLLYFKHSAYGSIAKKDHIRTMIFANAVSGY